MIPEMLTEQEKREGRLRFTIDELRRAGFVVEPADIHGLFKVNGRELTINQMVSLANQYDPGRIAMSGLDGF